MSAFPHCFAFAFDLGGMGGEWSCGELCVLWLWKVVMAVLCGGK